MIMTDNQTATFLAALKQEAADDSLIEQLAEHVFNRQTHIHPDEGHGADYYCLNLTSAMGAQMAHVLVRLREVHAEAERLRARTVRATDPADVCPELVDQVLAAWTLPLATTPGGLTAEQSARIAIAAVLAHLAGSPAEAAAR